MEGKKKLAVFDFDGTITFCDTLPEFIRFSCGWFRFIIGCLLHAPWIVACKCRLYSNSLAKQRLFGWFFSGMPSEEFNHLCEDFFQSCGSKLLRPEAVCCVEQYIQEGIPVAIVSASPENWVAPFARSLGVSVLLGTQLELTEESRLSGRFSSPNCYGEEKVRRLKLLYPDREAWYIVAYGDSRGDREMLAYADEPHYKPFRR